jgi:hypothetical protein
MKRPLHAAIILLSTAITSNALSTSAKAGVTFWDGGGTTLTIHGQTPDAPSALNSLNHLRVA